MPLSDQAGWNRPLDPLTAEAILKLWLHLARSALAPKQQQAFLRDPHLRQLSGYPLADLVHIVARA